LSEEDFMEPGGKTSILKKEEQIEEGQEEGQYNENL
jgi:hypothetical protein